MTPSRRLWSILRRDFKRGWEASRHYYRTLPRIAEWSWPFWNETPPPTPVHLLTGSHDWQQAAWTLASWIHFTERAWPIVIHDDGTLPEEGRGTLLRLFPKARLITRPAADEALGAVLRSYPFCADYRRSQPGALKIFDAAHFAAAHRFMIFTSDLLFFSYPREIVDWAAAGTNDCWFNEDAQENSLTTAAEARAELGVKIWPRVETGLCLLTKSAIDLDLCDRTLAQTSVLSGDGPRIEQTLFMLCAARHGKGGLLPRRYEVSLERNSSPSALSRHYGGPSADAFYAEGLARLHPILLPKEG